MAGFSHDAPGQAPNCPNGGPVEQSGCHLALGAYHKPLLTRMGPTGTMVDSRKSGIVAADVRRLTLKKTNGTEPPTPKMAWERGLQSARRGGGIGRGGINSVLRRRLLACRACRSAGILAGPPRAFHPLWRTKFTGTHVG